jgi:hypothetical protein
MDPSKSNILITIVYVNNCEKSNKNNVFRTLLCPYIDTCFLIDTIEFKS